MRSLLLDLLRYSVAYGRWIASFRRLWIAFAVVAIAAALSALLPGKAEDQIRYCGLALQLFGVGTVVLLLKDKTATFGRPGLLAYLRERLAARPRFRAQPQSVTLSGAECRSTAGVLRGSVWQGTPAGASAEDRLMALEQNAETLRKDLEWHASQARQASEQLRTELTSERQEREAKVTDVSRRLERLGAGGLHIEAAGLFWLILGIVLATVPHETAKLLGLAQ